MCCRFLFLTLAKLLMFFCQKNKSAVICRIRVINVSLSTFVKKQEKAILGRGNKIGRLATGAESTRYDMVIPRHKTDAKKT